MLQLSHFLARTVFNCGQQLKCKPETLQTASARSRTWSPDADKCTGRNQFKQRKQVCGTHVYTPAGSGLAKAGLIRDAMKINKALMRIHVASAISPRLKPFQPENAMCNGGIVPAL